MHSHTQNAPNPPENNHGALKWKLDTYRSTKGEWRPPKGNPEGHTKAGRVNNDSFELDSIYTQCCTVNRRRTSIAGLSLLIIQSLCLYQEKCHGHIRVCAYLSVCNLWLSSPSALVTGACAACRMSTQPSECNAIKENDWVPGLPH